MARTECMYNNQVRRVKQSEYVTLAEQMNILSTLPNYRWDKFVKADGLLPTSDHPVRDIGQQCITCCTECTYNR